MRGLRGAGPRHCLQDPPAPGSHAIARPYFCFQLPPASWYHQPPRALSTHCLAKTLADVLFPIGMAVGDRDFLVDRLAVAVVVGHGCLHADAVLQLERARIAQDDQAVLAEAERASVEALAQRGIETRGHARLDRLDRRRLDGDVRLRLRMGACRCRPGSADRCAAAGWPCRRTARLSSVRAWLSGFAPLGSSSPMTFSTNSFAASFASAAGK